MPVLTNSKHERFAQEVAKGASGTKAYVSAGYSKAGAKQNASRLITNDEVSERIKELQATISEGVVSLEIRKRSARVQALQVNLDRMRALIEARATEYAASPGGATGMLVRDFGGKNAEQEIWKFDGALVSQINDTLKQAAIEEGQWTEKRDVNATLAMDEIKARINRGRDRLAAEKKAALARGEKWN